MLRSVLYISYYHYRHCLQRKQQERASANASPLPNEQAM